MSHWGLAVASGVVAGYGAVSRRLATTVISRPLVFMLFGLVIGPLGLDLMSRARDPEVTRTLLESALVLLLFADATAIRARDLRREEFLPVRLLVVGLPATMALGWLLAWPLLSGLSVWELALAGIVLAPTDAALGQQAVANDRVPALIRGGLSVESGLNDGLALPFFVLALAAAGEGHGHPGVGETFLRALLLSGAIGLAAGWVGASLLRWSTARGWSSSDWQQFLALAVPVIAYALCAAAEGSGFIGAWTCGLAFGIRLRRAPAGRGDGARSPDPVQPGARRTRGLPGDARPDRPRTRVDSGRTALR
ncbi:NhaP-type Na+/H+ or K+/H+ antiporter [Kitasatospora sp. GP30]|uniref:cation:proton antiporter domain-containing protein n=1 Tax=Kitasatospora sp. GP30 TaxID=3035084 RepID=UPI000C70696D|nr:cation:proton antiporter [Kitasatospora sp. GP30]MDH6144304.1 NhaP-type Na+/H+ or K+/H+ antiporter [Kitasatospora sp. GP30]